MIDAEKLENIKTGTLLAVSQNNPQNVREVKKIFDEKIDLACNLFLAGEQLSDLERENIFFYVRDNISYPLKRATTVSDVSVRDDQWINNSDIVFNYAERYFEYLNIKKHWDETSIKTMKEDSLDIIRMLGNPKNPSPLHRKGLLIGDIQSGKTANYIAIMNRAIDVGYNIIILLAGMTSALREQTQKRVDSDVVGKTFENGKWTKVGVEDSKNLDKVLSYTSVEYDYSLKQSQTTHPQIDKNKTLLFVIKKNVSTLRYLYESLKNAQNETVILNDKKVINASLLLIDDEADNASIDTNKNELNPTAINTQIRNLISLFSNTAYLGVTGTPFANIFIDEEMKNEFGKDLFPSDFISIMDRPHSYLGARELFNDCIISDCEKKYKVSEATYKEKCINVIDDKEMISSYKYKHDKKLTLNSFSELPKSLKKAIRYFIIVQKLMDFLPATGIHRTMMINVSRFVDVQKNLYTILNTWLNEELKPQVRACAYNPQRFNGQSTGEFFELKEVWNEYQLGDISGMKWEEFTPLLAEDGLNELSIALVNNSKLSKELGGLRYSKDCPKRVIAVGGLCLSRGLTLEGLVVSYFYRKSIAYDTLLQMGRWFGYRNNYIQYFKVWMSDSSIGWYEIISDANEDLRIQVNSMNDQNLTPNQFGLMVKRHPCTGLIITANNKMRNAKLIDRKIPTDLKGRLIETPRLYKNYNANYENTCAVNKLLKSLSGEIKKGVYNNGYYWSGVPKEVIADFVRDFKSSQLSLGFYISDLYNYILKTSTDKWSVAIAQTSKNPIGSATIPGTNIIIKMIPRPYEVADNNIIKIYGHSVRIGSGNAPSLGLDYSDLEILKNHYKSEWEKNKRQTAPYLFNIDGMNRDCVLILYPLYLYNKKDESKKDSLNKSENDFLWGMGLGFVSSKQLVENDSYCYQYVMNPVAYRQNLLFNQEDDIPEDYDDDDEE